MRGASSVFDPAQSGVNFQVKLAGGWAEARDAGFSCEPGLTEVWRLVSESVDDV